MRTNRATTFLALSLVAILAVPAAVSNSFSPQSNMTEEEVVIQIESMTCSACATGVAASLRRIEGVIEAEVTLDPPEALIRFEASATSVEVLVEAVKDFGYEAEIVDS